MCVAFLTMGLVAGGQEPLGAVLERGYPAQWLVCGPFEAGLAGGVPGALAREEAALGQDDPFAPAGGVARMRPQPGVGVETSQGEFTWRALETDGPLADLADLFAAREAGVAYAAFYVRAARTEDVYFDVQTPLGARVYINGFPQSDVKAGPISMRGLDRFLVRLRAGRNLVVIQAPLASRAVLADAMGVEPGELGAGVFGNRDALDPERPYALAAELRPVRMFEGVAVVPRLENAGAFSGNAGSARQDAVLTLYNPQDRPSPPIALEVKLQGAGRRSEHIIPSIPPREEAQAIVSVPRGGADAGDTLPIEARFTIEGEELSLDLAAEALPLPEAGTVYAVAAAPRDEDAGSALAALTRQMELHEQERGYGFDFGAERLWRAWFSLDIGNRAAIREAAQAARCAPRLAYGPLDERIVGGETLVRNVAHGFHAARNLLGFTGEAAFAFGQPAVCPQTPQLLAGAGLYGLVSALPGRGHYALSWMRGPDGSMVMHRHKGEAPAPESAAELLSQAHQNRQPLLDLGLDSDVLVVDSGAAPPEPFYAGATERFLRSLPSLRVTGAGGTHFFNAADGALRHEDIRIPEAGPPSNRIRLGETISQPELKRAYGLAESALLRAERWAALAGTLGAPMATDEIDYAWRQMLYAGSPSAVGFSDSPRVYLRALSSCREAVSAAGRVTETSLARLASLIDTAEDAPAGMNPVALVVFNPSAFPRTGLVRTRVNLPGFSGLTLQEPGGEAVPFLAEDVERQQGRLTGARLRFVARDVPPLGYATYHLLPQGELPRPERGSRARLENDHFWVVLDPSRGGAINSIVSRETGEEHVGELAGEVALLPEDGNARAGGREIAIALNRSPLSTRAQQARITSSVTDWMQEVEVETPLGDGAVTQRFTVYEGLPWIDCEVSYDGEMGGGALAAVFDTAEDGAAPVHGERFGAWAAPAGPSALALRTSDPDRPVLAQPAYRWASLGPADHIWGGVDAAYPLGPCAITTSGSAELAHAATRLQQAVLERGYPCETYDDSQENGGRLATAGGDDTRFDQPHTDLRRHEFFRILMGHPDDNALIARALEQLTHGQEARFRKGLRGGTALFLLDATLPKGEGPVPTLILSGRTARDVERVALETADALWRSGRVQIPRESFLVDQPAAPPANGMALLFPGAALGGCRRTADARDGAMCLWLAHGSVWEEDDGLGIEPLPDKVRFTYAIYPYAGSWRDAGAPRMAQAYAEPLQAVAASIHQGTLPVEASFLSVDDPDFLVTSLRPAGYPAARGSGLEATVRQGLALRGFDSVGRGGNVGLTARFSLRRATLANLLDVPGGEAPSEAGRPYLETGAFSVLTALLYPPPPPRSQREAFESEAEDRVLNVQCDWRGQETGAAPPGNLPLSLVIDGTLRGGSSELIVRVANNQTSVSAAGDVVLSAPSSWKLAPAGFRYELGPLETASQKVVVLRQSAREPHGGVIARTRHNGDSYRALLEMGEADMLLAVSQREREVRVDIENRGALPAEGFVELITPPSHWQALGPDGAPAVWPERQPALIEPYGKERFIFHLRGDGPLEWGVAKAALNGRVQLRRLRPLPPAQANEPEVEEQS